MYASDRLVGDEIGDAGGGDSGDFGGGEPAPNDASS
jgi:hypothetical protein